MNTPDHLEENIKRLLETTEPQLKLPEQTTSKILEELAEESSKNSQLSLTKRVFSGLAVASAAAAMVVFAIMIVANGGKEAAARGYAIADTIEALQRVRTVHSICTGWNGKRLEVWKRINPDTGFADWLCFDYRPHGGIASTTPKGSCRWDAQGNVILLTNRQILSSNARYDSLFKELSQRMANPREGEKITIYKETEPKTGKDVIVIWEVTKLRDRKLYIDSATKLPLRTLWTRADNMLEVVRTVHQYSYNVELPKEFFDFEIPPEMVQDWSALDDSQNGLPADGLTHKQASVIIAGKLIEAMIAGDWQARRQYKPIDSLHKSYVENLRPVELLEVGKPYPRRGCSGLIVPCKIRMDDGKVLEIRPVVNWREIDAKPSVIIVAWWGTPTVIEEHLPMNNSREQRIN